MIFSRRDFGARGENIAKKYLENKGLKFICKNFVYKKKEIDLIFKDSVNKILVFVEVKTRADNIFADPESNINRKKIEVYEYVINGFLFKHPEYSGYDLRIDSIGIVLKGKSVKIRYFEGLNSKY